MQFTVFDTSFILYLAQEQTIFSLNQYFFFAVQRNVGDKMDTYYSHL